MDVYEAIRTRVSIRRYKPDPVPDSVLNKLLGAMRLAPSAANANAVARPIPELPPVTSATSPLDHWLTAAPFAQRTFGLRS